MSVSDIVIKGAREHNLRDVDLVLPRNQLICFTGVSGSGKSSLAFDTLYAEGQRRYVESLSSFARQFLGQMPKPDVDLISGLSPSISISQKSAGSNPRSTVGTITEIYDYLRVLYARVGQGYCPTCDLPISAQSPDQIIASIMQLPYGTKYTLLAPIIRAKKGEHRDVFADLIKQGFARVRVDGKVYSLSETLQLSRGQRHLIDVVVDRITQSEKIRARLAEGVELALKVGKGSLIIAVESSKGETEKGTSEDRVFSSDYACVKCGLGFVPPTPQMFSFNSPQGMCDRCTGLGRQFSFDPQLLIPDSSKSIQQGCIVPLGTWQDLGRWRRHIYKGVAETIERQRHLPPGTMLETAWDELPAELRQIWLYGSGDLHITFTWRGGNSPMKYGGKFDGIVSELMERYRQLKSAPKLRDLEAYMNEVTCSDCGGDRLNDQARHYRLATTSERYAGSQNKSLPDVCRLSIAEAIDFFSALELDPTRQFIATEPLKEIRNRLGFLINVGLDYLTLDRTAPTLSGGESQRIRLAGQIGAGLIGVLYILDEPSIGLHSADNRRLIDTLARLRDLGNTVVVVEHDEETMRSADCVIDFGPGPGSRGGEIVFQGTPEKLAQCEASLTGQFLGGHRRIEIPSQRRNRNPARQLTIINARQNNLKGIDIEIPLGLFVCVTGVSGSGKSSFVSDILVETLREELNSGIGNAGHFDRIEGIELLDKMIAIDQAPIGRTPRSNPGTYIKLFDEIRKLYSQLPEAKRRGFQPGRFSFNVKGGRCEACEGNGSNKLEMDFLSDIWVTCPVCQGHRFNRETLQVTFREKSIADVLEMEIDSALHFFENVPKIKEKLETLYNVGLNYLQIGQPSPTLSGGEAQRIKLARELVKRSTGKTLYLLDEPTTGLHFADIQLLLRVLHNFVEAGNTVLVVEHNLDVIKTADWIIDMGPGGGVHGGEIVVAGTPEDVAACEKSKTGRALADLFAGRHATPAAEAKKQKHSGIGDGDESRHIRVRGAQQHNLRGVDADIPRDRMSVFCGPSGSGKSSLAMDTIYAEGQRRYVESLSSYARQFVSQLEKPRVEQIDGLSPAIAIEQKNLGSTPRSTVGTVTEIYDYLRILYSRLGTPYCPDCDLPIGTQTSDQIVDRILSQPDGTRLIVTAPLERDPNQSYEELWSDLRSKGFSRIRIDGVTSDLEAMPDIGRRTVHEMEIVIDRIVVKRAARSRIADSVESGLSIGKGVIRILMPNDELPEPYWERMTHSQHLACEQCGSGFELLSPHSFSFNSRLGWCGDCEGLGTRIGADPRLVMKNPDLSLAEGALALWPDLNSSLSRGMLETICKATQIPIDKPFAELDARQRRLIFFGTGHRWFDLRSETGVVLFSFQFKGLYPTLEEAARLLPSLRMQLSTFVGDVECSTCGGGRLRRDAGAVRFRDQVIDGVCRMPLGKLAETISQWSLSKREQQIAGELIHEIKSRVNFLNDVGLEYLTLNRTAASLSNGEAQRIRLARQLGSGLCGVLYVLDEPTIGLHPRDNRRLIGALHRLRDLGNTLIVVEHDREVIENADHVFDFGPKAGAEGGEIVCEGTPRKLSSAKNSVTGPYLSGSKSIPVPSNRRLALKRQPNAGRERKGKRAGNSVADKKPISLPEANTIEIFGASHNNLKNVDVRIPLGTLTVVTGPSGSGKSSLINDVLYNSLARRLHRATARPGACRSIGGIQHVNKVISVDQSPLGNSPTSNPATYTGAFDLIRELFAYLPDARIRGFTARRFSFNVPGGRCEQCMGNGQICIEMHFLPDVWVPCQVCQGRRYNEETLAVRFHDKSINDLLEMRCGEAVKLFKNIPRIRRIVQTLCDVGLDYLTLGQSAPTLSGGEAQRVKLAAELARPDTGRTLYLLDEPTTGLHFDDLAKLLEVIQRLVDLGNTVVLIEHNLDIIKAADWVIDMGPEAGQQGGQVVVQGTPEDVAAYAAKWNGKNGELRSWTGEALAEVLRKADYQQRQTYDAITTDRWKQGDMELHEVGVNVKSPWQVDGQRWHTKDRVGRNGEQVHWDGKILREVVQRIEQHDGFSETNWNERTVVEICGRSKSAGWFFHAITGDAWLLTMKFRVRPKTFRSQELLNRISLPTANEMDELPIYGNQSRVAVTNTRNHWQEIEIRPHSWKEIDTPEFWQFVDEAVESFLNRAKRAALKLEDQTPWAKLGEKWHLLRKGFAQGEIVWNVNVLQSMKAVIENVASKAEFVWDNKTVVHVYLPELPSPWISIHSKKPDGLWINLSANKGQVNLGRVVGIADDVSVVPNSDRELVRMKFVNERQVLDPNWRLFLLEHLNNSNSSIKA